MSSFAGLRLHISHKRRPVKRSLAGTAVIMFFVLLLGAFLALPFVYAIAQSLKPLNEIFVYPPKFFVRNPSFDNYYMLSQMTKNSLVPFFRYIFNSIFISTLATFLHVIASSMAAFPLAKSKFPYRRVLSKIVVLSLLFTPEVTAIPQFVLMSRIGLLDTYLALLLPPIASSLGLYLMQQFMTDMPDSIIEAGRIDGASMFTILWRIIMPAVKPAWLTLVVLSFQSVWNREGTEYIFNESLKMLPTLLKQITTSGISQMGAASAAAVILMIPPIFVFLLTQSNIIETMAQSGIKE